MFATAATFGASDCFRFNSPAYPASALCRFPRFGFYIDLRRRRMKAPSTRPAPPSKIVEGSGTGDKNPGISPPGNATVWMFKYACPAANPAAKVASAPAAVPPLAAINAGLKLAASVVSKTFE